MNILISVFMILGALFILIAAIGMLRFNDFFSRIHASTKATSFGLILLLISVVLYFGNWNIAIKSILIILFIYLTAPLAAHSISKSHRDKKQTKN